MHIAPVATSRKVADTLDCVRPLLFDNKLEAFPYSIAGTCFLVEYEHRPFVVTAAHIFFNHQRGVQEAAVQYDRLKPAMIPLCRAFLPGDDHYPDAERLDLAILQVDPSKVDTELWRAASPLQLSRDDSLTLCSPTNPYLLGGYPSAGNEVNYGEFEKHIHLTRVRMGLTASASPPWKECISFASPDDPDLPEFDGLSGAPVLQAVPVSENIFLPLFAGMVIRGGKERRLFYAVSGRFITSNLQRICSLLDTGQS